MEIKNGDFNDEGAGNVFKSDEVPISKESYPVLKIEKTNLSFQASVGKVAFSGINIKNEGNCSVQIKWKKSQIPTSFEFESDDKMDYFHIHYVMCVLNPNEEKNFTFTFHSDQPGHFHTNYIIETDPKLPEELPVIELSGYSILKDDNMTERRNFSQRIRNSHNWRFCSEIVDDIVGRVRTPTPPPPDYNVLKNREIEFERVNRDKLLYYTDSAYRMFLKLQEDVKPLANIPIEEGEESVEEQEMDWGFDVDTLKLWIESVSDLELKENLLRRWNDYVYLSKKKPVNKTPIYALVKKVLKDFSSVIPDESERVLEDMGFGKKKFKNDEDKEKFLDGYKEKLAEEATTALGEMVTNFDESLSSFQDFIKFDFFNYKHNEEFIDKLSRIHCMKDADIESRKILVKLNLRIDEEKLRKVKFRIRPSKEETEENGKKGGKDKKKQKKGKEEEEQPDVEELQIRMSKELIEEESLDILKRNIRTLINANPKFIMLLVSFSLPPPKQAQNPYLDPQNAYQLYQKKLEESEEDEKKKDKKGKKGKNEEEEVIFDFETLQKTLPINLTEEELSVDFLTDYINNIFDLAPIKIPEFVIPDWKEKLENEEYEEGSILIFPNISLDKRELGYETMTKEIELKDEPEEEDKKKKKAKKGEEEEEIPTEERFRVSVLKSEREKLAKVFASYTDVYVFDDPYQFGDRDKMTNLMIKCDQTVLGNRIKERLNYIFNTFDTHAQDSLCILGGKFDERKLFFLRSSIKFFNTVFIIGDIALNFERFLNNDETLPELVADCIREILWLFEEDEDKQLVLPLDFNYIPQEVLMPEARGSEDDQSKEEVEEEKKKKKGEDEETPRARLIDFLKDVQIADEITEEQLEFVQSSTQVGYFREIFSVKPPTEPSHISEEEEAGEEEEVIDTQTSRKGKKSIRNSGKTTKRGNESPKIIEVNEEEGDEVIEEQEPEDTTVYYTNDKYLLDFGEQTRDLLTQKVKSSKFIFWLGNTTLQPYQHLGDRNLAKLLKEQRSGFKEEEEGLTEEQKMDYVPFHVSIVGTKLINSINSYNLKDPKVKRERAAREERDGSDDEEYDEEAEEEYEEEEEEEEEESEFDEDFEFDEDMNTEEMRKMRRKQNVDHITEVYHHDLEFFLKIMNGQYFEEFDYYDQGKKDVKNPDSIDFSFLKEI